MTNRSTMLLAILVIAVAFYALVVLGYQGNIPLVQPPRITLDSYAGVVQELARTDSRGIAKVQSIGKSVMGNRIYVVWPKTTSRHSGRLLIIAGQHGVEPLPVQAVMQMITSQQFSSSSVRVAVIPVANPDCYMMPYRRNWKGRDINRDWPRPTQPETIAISAFIKQFQPDVVIDLHEGLPYTVEVARTPRANTQASALKLADAGISRSSAVGFPLKRLPNSSGVGSGLIHRCIGARGRVGLMMESPVDYRRDRQLAYAAFVAGVMDRMQKPR